MQPLSTYFSEANLVFRQGQQLYHLHQMLKEHPEQAVIAGIGRTYCRLGSAPTYSAGLIMGASVDREPAQEHDSGLESARERAGEPGLDG